MYIYVYTYLCIYWYYIWFYISYKGWVFTNIWNGYLRIYEMSIYRKLHINIQWTIDLWQSTTSVLHYLITKVMRGYETLTREYFTNVKQLITSPLQWHHNECDSVSNHRRLHCLVNCWFRGRWKIHSVESPSTVDPQWDIWYWGSKWNLHSVCWSAVGCEWGTTSVYFGITYVCFIPSRLPVFAVEPQYLLQDFLFLSKLSFEGHIQNLQKISCWFKIWMGFVGPKLIKLWTSSIWGFL